MKFLHNSKDIENKLIKLIENCESMQVAVAWATSNHIVFETLYRHRKKINKFVVGTHFFQTDPYFLEKFIDNERVRVIYETGDVFHPKLYYFKFKKGWECLVGSANFTRGAMLKNKEVLVSFSSNDRDVSSTEIEIWSTMSEYFRVGHVIKQDYLEKYKVHYDKKRHIRMSLSTNNSDGQKSVFSQNEIYNYPWKNYVDKLHQNDSDSIKDRGKLLNYVNQYFKESSFEELEYEK